MPEGTAERSPRFDAELALGDAVDAFYPAVFGEDHQPVADALEHGVDAALFDEQALEVGCAELAQRQAHGLGGAVSRANPSGRGLFARQDEEIVLHEHDARPALVVERRDLVGHGLRIAQAVAPALLARVRGDAAVVAFSDAPAGGDEKIDGDAPDDVGLGAARGRRAGA